MIGIGIPSYNEADNIGRLVNDIDAYAHDTGQTIVMINSDNNSPDGTAAVFRSTETYSEKISLHTEEAGKGRNVENIVRYIAKNDIGYCILVDADVTSFEPVWLEKHQRAATEGFDYVVPNYGRYFFEGNATNHFAHPVLSYFSDGQAPRQPIAGDFGLSLKFAKHMAAMEWCGSVLRYGVDMFLTNHALGSDAKIKEIVLPKKIHSPSFNKMIGIFIDEAAAYFGTRQSLDFSKSYFESEVTDQALLDGITISQGQIAARKQEALNINATSSLKTGIRLSPDMTVDDWAEVLVRHEELADEHDALLVAQSLCGYYLMRVATYLENIKSASAASQELEKQKQVIFNAYREAGL